MMLFRWFLESRLVPALADYLPCMKKTVFGERLTGSPWNGYLCVQAPCPHVTRALGFFMWLTPT